MQPKYLAGAAALSAAFILAATPVSAATVFVDLSGSTTGTTVTGVNASFAQGFSFAPLALSPSGTIDVAFFNPGVSAASNSLLSQPGNAAPLAALLAGNIANSITFTAGSAAGGAVTISGYDAAGNLTGSTLLNFLDGYNVYTIGGIGNFAGVQFSNTDDPAGVRYMNISYETVDAAIPEPATWAMLIAGFMMTGGAMRSAQRRTRLAVSYG